MQNSLVEDLSVAIVIGAIWDALGEITGKKLRVVHTESGLRGGTHDVFEFSVFE